MTFENDLTGDEPGDFPAAAGSQLESMRDRRRRRRAAMHFDRKVPGFDPPVFVRYKPADLGRLAAAIKTAEKSKNQDAIAIAHASVLISACIGVFEVDEHGDEVSIDPRDRHGEWPRFDQRLGELLADEGETLTRASDVVRALFDNDMALGEASDALIDWSRSMNEDLERESTGN